MTEEALKRFTGGSECESVESKPAAAKVITPRRKEALVRALSNLDAMKRMADPEVVGEVVSRHLDHHANNQQLPPLITRFLDIHLRSYLTHLYAFEGEQGEDWCIALKNTEDLTWSLRPKSDDESRRRLYVILPGLFQWIHGVLKSEQVAVPEEDRFFTELAELQVAALHSVAPVQPSPQIPCAPNEQTMSCQGDTRKWEAGANHLHPVGGQDRVARHGKAAKSATSDNPAVGCPVSGPVGEMGDHGKTVGPADSGHEERQTSPGRSAEMDLLGYLGIGARVQLQSNRATKRMLRLEWISRSGSVYLFRDQKRGDALCLTADRCVQCLRNGSVSILSRGETAARAFASAR